MICRSMQRLSPALRPSAVASQAAGTSDYSLGIYARKQIIITVATEDNWRVTVHR